MTSIHDDDPGSRPDAAHAQAPPARALPPEWERLARRMDELETVLAAGRIGYCRLRAADLALRANSQFKAEWGWPPDEAHGAGPAGARCAAALDRIARPRGQERR